MALLILLVVYSILAKYIIGEINKKATEYIDVINDTEQKTAAIMMDKRRIDARVGEYESIIAIMEQSNSEVIETITGRNAIPNLLNRIMYAIPKEVQLTNLKNTSGKVIQIEAQSDRYQYLGFFIAKIKNDGILTEVTSTEGTKAGGIIKITITGKLPY